MSGFIYDIFFKANANYTVYGSIITKVKIIQLELACAKKLPDEKQQS
jgi:hypothetical protein